jgi:hypothetical protein
MFRDIFEHTGKREKNNNSIPQNKNFFQETRLWEFIECIMMFFTFINITVANKRYFTYDRKDSCPLLHRLLSISKLLNRNEVISSVYHPYSAINVRRIKNLLGSKVNATLTAPICTKCSHSVKFLDVLPTDFFQNQIMSKNIDRANRTKFHLGS